MKRLSIILCICLFSFYGIAQTSPGWNKTFIATNISGFVFHKPVMVWLPNGYNPASPKKYPVIWSFHGNGEIGTDTVGVLNNGLPNAVNNGIYPSAVNPVDGLRYDFIIIAPQNNSAAPRPEWFPAMFQEAKTRWNIDTTRMYLTGYSSGGFATLGITLNFTFSADTFYSKKIAATVPMSPSTQDDSTQRTKVFSRWNIHGLAISGNNSGNNPYIGNQRALCDSVDNYSPNMFYCVEISGEGHCCWAAKWDTTYVIPGLSPTKNIFQWLLQYSQGSAGNSPPTAAAGSDQVITLPTTTTTLVGSGSDIDGTIASFAWTKFSGPAGGTITSPSSSTTGITALQQGVYVFRLTVTDNLGATGFDDVQVTVNPAGSPLTVDAGPDYSQGDSLPIIQLSCTTTAGQAPITFHWDNIQSANGNDWNKNLLNPDEQSTQALYTGVFSTGPTKYYKYVVTATDAVGAVAKDTITINVTYSHGATSTGTLRYVTTADSLNSDATQWTTGIMSPSRHDQYIPGANTDNYAGNVTITTTLLKLYPDARVHIEHGIYYQINLTINKDSILADSAHKFRIVNYNGQVQWFDFLRFLGTLKYGMLDGSYNIADKTGSPNYPGKDGGYVNRQGKYGFYGNNGWTNVDDVILVTDPCDTVHHFIFNMLELGNGSPYGLHMGKSGNSNPIHHNKFLNLYIHDVGAEGIYLAINSGDPQQRFTDNEMSNTIIARAGQESPQLGMWGGRNIIQHNVFDHCSMARLNPTHGWDQDGGMQIYTRENGSDFSYNIVNGSGGQLFSLLFNKPPSETLTTDSVTITNNLGFGSGGHNTLYFGCQASGPGAFRLAIRGNYFGFNEYKEGVTKSSAQYNNTVNVYKVDNSLSPAMGVTLKDNVSDTTGGKTTWPVGAGVTQSNNTMVNSILFPKFSHPGYPGQFNAHRITQWVDTIGWTSHKEDVGTGERQYTPYTYQTDDTVRHAKWYYVALQPSQGKPPVPKTTNAYWKYLGTCAIFPDDFRLKGSDPNNTIYLQKGIGLLDVDNDIIPQTHPIFRRGRKFIFKP